MTPPNMILCYRHTFAPKAPVCYGICHYGTASSLTLQKFEPLVKICGIVWFFHCWEQKKLSQAWVEQATSR